jgi:hypothetical protein
MARGHYNFLKALFERQPEAVMTKRAGRFLADDLVSRIGALARNWDAPIEARYF